MTRTIPTKEQVLEAARRYPQTKNALEILFPQDFEEEFDWKDFYSYPFKYLKTEEPDMITPSEELFKAYKKRGFEVPESLWPHVSLGMLIDLLNLLNRNKG